MNSYPQQMHVPRGYGGPRPPAPPVPPEEPTLTRELKGHDPGTLPMLNKINDTHIGQEVAKLAQRLLGTESALAPRGQPEGTTSGNEKWTNQFMGSLGMAIAGGTSNIQRNIIAERGLGLPRDRAADREA